MIDRLRTHLDDLLQTRRGVLIAATGAILLALVIRLLISGSRIPVEGRLATAIALALFASGTALSFRRGNRTWALWLFPLALVTPLSAIAAGTGQAQWLPLNLLVTSAGALAALLVSTRVALALAVIAPAMLFALWRGQPDSVVPLGIGVAGGWVATFACVLSIITMTWAWQALTQRARRLDAMQEQRVRLATEVIEQQERSSAWRTTALRIHESLLNSVRQVLAGGDIDRLTLRNELGPFAAPGYVWESNAPAPISALFAQVAADLRHDPALRFVTSETEVVLQPNTLHALRPALVEAVRNAIHHGQASEVELSARSDASHLVFTVEDNGLGFRGDARPGFGSTGVMTRSVGEIGGQLERRERDSGGVAITITVPNQPQMPSGRSRRTPAYSGGQTMSRFNAGRILITGPLAGSVVGGLLFMPFIAAQRELVAIIIALLGIALCVTVGYVQIRWRQLRGMQAVLAIAPAVLLTALASMLESGCDNVNTLAAVVNTAGLSVVVLAAWSSWPVALGGLLAWGAGAILLYGSVPLSCGQPLHLAVINVLFVFPMIILGTTVGARALARTRAREEDIANLEIRALARYAATREISNRLQDSVEAAVNVLEQIAQGAPVDVRRRRELECLDGRIRMEIQVDPAQAGGFALLARHLGEACWSRGIPLEIRAVQSSGDARPVSEEAIEQLCTIVVAANGRASVHAFTDGEEDHLCITTPTSSVSQAGLALGRSKRFGQATLWVEDGAGEDERIAVVLSREVDTASDAIQSSEFAASRRL